MYIPDLSGNSNTILKINSYNAALDGKGNFENNICYVQNTFSIFSISAKLLRFKKSIL